MALTKDCLMYIVHHAFLPPELPKDGDKDTQDPKCFELINNLQEALATFKTKVDSSHALIISHVNDAISSLAHLVDHSTGPSLAVRLQGEIDAAKDHDAILPIFVSAQNAGIIIRTDTTSETDHAIIEMFELTPPNDIVVGTRGRVRRVFPGKHVITLDKNTFRNIDFQATLCDTIGTLCSENCAEMLAKARKSGETPIEDRDTTNPALVTELLAGFLLACGKSTTTTAQISKSTREEVLWRDGRWAWHRSPAYLLARVAMQTSFAKAGVYTSHDLYKEFMIFFFASILKKALRVTEPEIDMNILHCMICKITKRMAKLDRSYGPRDTLKARPWLCSVQATISDAQAVLTQRWKTIMVSADPNISLISLKQLDFVQDAAAEIPRLDAYIHHINNPPESDMKCNFVPPKLSTLLSPHELPQKVCPNVSAKNKNHKLHQLAAFECWIEDHLGTWILSNINEPSTCEKLLQTLHDYHKEAAGCYSDNPEAFSVMVLVCLEIWVACDRSACALFPLLCDYAVPLDGKVGILESLLLPRRSQMVRLLAVESYICNRKASADPNLPSILLSFGTPDSFGVRFYASAVEMHELHSQIVSDAESEKLQKLSEFHQKKTEHDNLLFESRSISCTYITEYDSYWNRHKIIHSSQCHKCRLEATAGAMNIEIFEYPLPTDTWEQHNTVFELCRPVALGFWRDATHFVDLEVLENKFEGGCFKNKFEGRSYGLASCLENYLKVSPGRLRLCSETKPAKVTHRKGLKVSEATESTVCVRNGLNYEYYDSNKELYMCDVKKTDNVPHKCMYKIPDAAALQQFLYRPDFTANGPDSNMVVSELPKSPQNLSLKEFKALATLPYGTETQWPNLLVQLAIPSVDFKRLGTHLVLLQMLHQAGPSYRHPGRSGDSAARASHRIITMSSFQYQILGNLKVSLDHIRENWESYQALATYIAIAKKLREFSSTAQLSSDLEKFLMDCRHASLVWLRLLREKARSADDPAERIGFIQKAFEMALVSTTTFEFDGLLLSALLGNVESAASFLELAVNIEETSYSVNKDTDNFLIMCHQRWVSLSVRALPVLLQTILDKESPCLDNAIHYVWSDYSPGHGQWAKCEGAHHWVANKESHSGVVHFNLLTGELLVRGLPVSRLPFQYESLPIYKTIFGNTTVEVMGTTEPGMSFSAIRPVSDYNLYFSLDMEEDLRLVAKKDGDTFDLIPRHVLIGQIPTHFLEGYIHWYCREKGVVEFRPLKKPWDTSTDLWVLSHAFKSKSWNMQTTDTTGKSKMLIFDRNAATTAEMARIYRHVETIDHMHLTYQADKLTVALPRINIQFQLLSGTDRLVSREIRGMVLDMSTNIGTLTGLSSKIVLRNDFGKRAVLVPDGDVHFEGSTNSHVHASCSSGATRVFHYEIDDELHRLVDDASVDSKLHLCYLHAITGACIDDPLTMQTGIERAISILTETDIRSASRLTQRNIDTITDIASLIPKRKFYPHGLRVMESVKWHSEISFISQHFVLFKKAQELLADAKKREFFHHGQPELCFPRKLDQVITHLHDRASARTSMFYRRALSLHERFGNDDVTYLGRAKESFQTRRIAAYLTARSIMLRQIVLPPTSLNASTLWYRFASSGENILGIDESATVGIKFSAQLLVSTRRIIAKNWLPLDNTLRTQSRTKFSVAIFMATLAFPKDADLDCVRILCTIYNGALDDMPALPVANVYDLARGKTPEMGQIKHEVANNAKPFRTSAESGMARLLDESQGAYDKRRKDEFNTKSTRAVEFFSLSIMENWPCASPNKPNPDQAQYINVVPTMAGLRRHFQLWWDNKCFYEYLEDLVQEVSLQPTYHEQLPPIHLERPAPALRPVSYTLVNDLFRDNPGRHLDSAADARLGRYYGKKSSVKRRYCIKNTTACTYQESPTLSGLGELVGRLDNIAGQGFKVAYTQDLRTSISCINDVQSPIIDMPMVQGKEANAEFYQNMLSHSKAALTNMENLVKDSTVGALPFFEQYLAPQACPLLYLSQMTRLAWKGLTSKWRKVLTAYALTILDVQRAHRLVASSLSGNKNNLARELANPGHTNWNPLEYPECILQEVMGGILARDVQIDIFRQMSKPPKMKNAAMQLNMGEGKSSVIVPMTAACLADGHRLVVVIVGKPQSKQMLQMLVSKLGGICGRRVYHMPFSRSLLLGMDNYRFLLDMCRECMSSGGVLLAQPEHLLSLQLAGPELVLAGETAKAQVVLQVRRFMEENARYIVDESDENFSVKFELVYTMGTPDTVELSPDRWVICQAVLNILHGAALKALKELPQSVEIDAGAVYGSFPRIRFLRDDGRDLVCRFVAESICSNGLPGLPIGRQLSAMRHTIFKYITEASVSDETRQSVEENAELWTETVRPRLLLVRGLIGRGVLGFAFGTKRWRVNYGLDTSRRPPTRLAIPYRAKDNPAPRAEFSHTDVIIVLTCLAYYYGGLEDDELFECFEKLLLSDQAEVEYSDWVQTAPPALATAFRTLGGINLKDRHQCLRKVFPHLRKSKGAVDFYLTKIVFPKEMRQFPQKLSASGWDIGRQQAHPTTGFSGTSDSQHLLPLSVKHLDLKSQRHTNALVLQYLLQPENSVVYMPLASASQEHTSDADRFLQQILSSSQPIQVVLDAGAQILELDNRQFAERWLKMSNGEKEAVVFCDDNDDIVVVDRSGHMEKLSTSPFLHQLDLCLVFLDEAHTRGIDLKLPDNYRAAVTLGPGLTKDRLVQACMRMRKLGKGQSVAFYVPYDIQGKIALLFGRPVGTVLSCTVADVLIWSITETWSDLGRSIPLWALQGLRFQRQKTTWESLEGGDNGAAERFLEKEAMSLVDLYAPARADVPEFMSPDDIVDSKDLKRIRERYVQFDAHEHAGSASLHEEQERELAPEIEQEKQIERPHPLPPAKHRLHDDIINFACTGKRAQAGPYKSFVPAFQSLSNTSAAEFLDMQQFPSDGCLYVTTEFQQTVVFPSSHGVVQYSDSYLRSVQWVLAHQVDGRFKTMLVISPYEAQLLIPRESEFASEVRLHLYAPRSSLSYKPLDHLGLFAFGRPFYGPPQGAPVTDPLVLQLNLFAGQLYFGSLVEYKAMCAWLGLASEATEDESRVLEVDGFITQGPGKHPSFKKSPVPFLKVFLPKVRWNCDSISRTHWGKVLDGQFLDESDFEETACVEEAEDGDNK